MKCEFVDNVQEYSKMMTENEINKTRDPWNSRFFKISYGMNLALEHWVWVWN